MELDATLCTFDQAMEMVDTTIDVMAGICGLSPEEMNDKLYGYAEYDEHLRLTLVPGAGSGELTQTLAMMLMVTESASSRTRPDSSGDGGPADDGVQREPAAMAEPPGRV